MILSRHGSIVMVLTLTLLAAAILPSLVPDPHDGVTASIAFEGDILINQDLEAATPQANPDVVVHGNDVYVFWQELNREIDPENWDIYSRASHDGGLNFGPEVRVDDTRITDDIADDYSDQTLPRAAVAPDGTIYVVFSDNREGRNLINMAVSTDAGASFDTNVKVADHVTGVQTKPDIDHDGVDTVHITWEDTRDNGVDPMIYTTQTQDGSTFSNAIKVSDVSSSYRCLDPRITAVEKGGVHIVWSDDRVWDEDIYIANSLNGGSSFDPSVRISKDPTGSDQVTPDISGNDDILYVVWSDPRYSSSDIYMAISQNNGTSFSLEECVHPNHTIGAQIDPSVHLAGTGNVTISWTSSPGFYDKRSDIQLTRYYPNGTLDDVFTVNMNIQDTTQDQGAFGVGEDDRACFAWRDNRNSGEHDIYFTRTTESGEEGNAPDLVDAQINPEIGVKGDTFSFKVTYFDVENDAPAKGNPKVNLFYRTAGGALYPYPGSPFNMSLRLMPAPDFDFRNGETYIRSMVINRDLDLYYYISARASQGNLTEVRTDFLHLPVIDSQGPTFRLISPDENSWISENIIEFKVELTDDLSGVDPWSVFYQTYQEEKGGWDRWQRKGTSVTVDNLTILYSVNVTFLEGKENLIRFRAKDMLGNGGEEEEYSVSETYHVWVDATGPIVEIISPRTGATFENPQVQVLARIVDAGVGVDPDTITVSYSLNGVEGFGPWQNLSLLKGSLELTEEGVDVMFNVSLAFGYFNFIKVRTEDLLGNGGISSNIQIIIRERDEVVVDRPPSAVQSIQPRVSGSVRPHITWSPSFDPDGDMVTYNITIQDQTSGNFIVEEHPVIPGDTYWDPLPNQLFTPGHIYFIEIIPHANGKNGPVTNSTLLISTDANYPPEPVSGFEPAATSDTSPVLRWSPSMDPDGDDVYYFLRVGRYLGGSDILSWTSVFRDTRYPLNKQLSVGNYYVDILCSDGKDFAPISHFTMSLGVYNPVVTVQRTTVTVY
ncbi:MAG: hypothetical protein JW939_05290, partial [Candidatus Thermoplasmatota archaeon]|nr:hypothetical protein [Candidatus Thermoplasmatota archaeon]